jgi:adenylate kinase family enzyme
MNTVEEYFQSAEYRDQKQEIRQIDDLILEVAPTFSDFMTDEGVPYEISDGTSVEFTKSSSTIAMILFVIAQLLGWPRKSVLAPIPPRCLAHHRDNRWKDVRAKLNICFGRGFRILLKIADGNRKPPPYFKSGSFGEDDPFTFGWTVALLAFLPPVATALPVGLELSEETTSLLKRLGQNLIDRANETIEEAFSHEPDKVLKLSERGQDGRPADHLFPLLRSVYLHSLIRGFFDSDAVPSKALKSVHQRFLSRLHEQLSLSAITDASFDVAELAFALEGYVLTIENDASIDQAIVNRVFQVLRDAQGRSAYWRPLKPFVTMPQGHALLPLSVEIANSLLRTCVSLRRRGEQDHFSKNIDLFRRYAAWLYTRIARGKAVVVVNQSGKKSKKSEKTFVGWHSEHTYVPGRIHPWETSQVLMFLLPYREMLQQYIADISLTKANLEPKWQESKKVGSWDATTLRKEFRPFEPLPSLAEVASNKPNRYRLYEQIITKYLLPRLKEGIVDRKAACSILLYGPAGTGKTTAPKKIAEILHWPLVTITPSDFISHGESEVETRAKIIFKTLEEQSDKVILFDEIDRMILDRDSPAYHRQADIFQFMTPSMLVKLQDLRARGSCIFLIATNYEERIDLAVKRKGRIDDALLIAPPDREQRVSILVNQIADQLLPERKGASDDKKKESEDLIRSFLSSEEWRRVGDKTVLMVFGELEQFASGAGAVKDGAKNGDTVRQRLLNECENPQPPSIRLTSYFGRLGEPKEKSSPDRHAASQEPLVEFLVLLYLRCEACENVPFISEEKELIKRVLGRFTKDTASPRKEELQKKLGEFIGDFDIANTIIEGLTSIYS